MGLEAFFNKDTADNVAADTTGAAPVANTDIIELNLSQIDAYEDNPRKQPNPKRCDLKASIRVNNVEEMLIVTQRPGDTRYVLARGGNTRLDILNELYGETHDARFYRQRVRVVPWVSEANLLAAHLEENDDRAPLAWIDRAAGVQQLREKWNAEASEPLSLAEVVQRFAERGTKMHKPTLSLMEFVVTTLLPALPLALATWGRDTAQKMSKVYNDALKLLRVGGHEEEEARAWLQETLQTLDSEEQTPCTLEASVLEEVGLLLDTPSPTLHKQWERLKEGKPLEPVAPPPPPPAIDVPGEEPSNGNGNGHGNTRNLTREQKLLRKVRKAAQEVAAGIRLKDNFNPVGDSYQIIEGEGGGLDNRNPGVWLLKFATGNTPETAPSMADYLAFLRSLGKVERAAVEKLAGLVVDQTPK